MEVKKLGVYTYVDGVNDIPFPNSEYQLEIGEYTFTDYRMGIPVMSASVNYQVPLDSLWTKKEYVSFGGEKYWVTQTPTSSKNTDNIMFKHDITFNSERDILNHVYFEDVVTNDVAVDRYVSNSTNVVFYGDLSEFVQRLNYSLNKRNIGYSVVIDEGITSDAVEASFVDQYIMDALQSAYENYFKVPFYFSGKVIHFGLSGNAITYPFKYGSDEALLGITKTNANYKIINVIKATGTTENIPYYYPNASGDRAAIEAAGGTWVTPVSTLMPPIFRESLGETDFYEALNNTYINPDTSDYYHFNNPYTQQTISQFKVDLSDIKPTILGMTNASGDLMAVFDGFAYDSDDSDEIDNDGNFLHPYFYAKLRIFNGTYGFNIFDSGIVGSDMTINFTSGVLGACKCKIMTTYNETTGVYSNPVQVDGSGLIVPGTKDDKIKIDNIQPQQQDTSQYSVWVALEKDNSTFGVVLPNAANNYKPSAGDTFNVTNINLPQSYILFAENKMKEAMIKYMAGNNDEKFNFTINLSRVFVGENDAVAGQINANASLIIDYNDEQVTQYINTYTYKAEESDIVPQISVDLSETISVNKNALESTVDAVKEDILSSVNNIDFFKQGLRYFLRKDTEDYAKKLITFISGLRSLGNIEIGSFTSGAEGAGGIIRLDADGKTYIEVDKAYIRLKAIFESLEIREKTYVGGENILSHAGIVCNKVEGIDVNGDVTTVTENIVKYRCYFLREQDGVVVNNQFSVGSLAICKTENINEGLSTNASNKYYWREVVSIGDDYIDLSVTESDTGSDIPESGDKIVALGHKTDTSKQAALVLSSMSDNAPSITFYQGINSFSLLDKNVIDFGYDQSTNKPYMHIYGDSYVGARDQSTYMKYTPEDGVEIKGKLSVTAGSTGASNLGDLSDEVLKAAQTGVVNLLLNTGFVGDYETIDLDGSTDLNPDTEMYSPSLKNWVGTGTVNEELLATYGFSVYIGSLSQSVTMTDNEQYVFHCKAKGSSLTVSCGNYTSTTSLMDEYQEVVFKFAFSGSNIFSISGDATIYDPMLTRGTMTVDYNRSPLDADSTKAEFLAYQDIRSLFVGNTSIIGALIQTGMILLGNYKDGEFVKNTAGISGIYNDDNSVAVFGGGTYEQALYTISKYLENPKYQPTTEELANMAKFVVTHGGRGIFNDVIVRGTVYADNGLFKGKIEQANGFNVMNEDGSVSFANGKITWGINGDVLIRATITTSDGNKRIEINPTTNEIALYNSYNYKIGAMQFLDSVWNGTTLSLPRIQLKRVARVNDSNYESGLLSIDPSSLYIYTEVGEDNFQMSLTPNAGLVFQKNGVETKNYPNI